MHLLCARFRAKWVSVSPFSFHFHGNPPGWVLFWTLQILWVPHLASVPKVVTSSKQTSIHFVYVHWKGTPFWPKPPTSYFLPWEFSDFWAWDATQPRSSGVNAYVATPNQWRQESVDRYFPFSLARQTLLRPISQVSPEGPSEMEHQLPAALTT